MHRAGNLLMGSLVLLAIAGPVAAEGEPVIRVLVAEGEPGMTRPDGEEVVLGAGSVVPPGYTVWTGPTAKVALVFATDRDTPNEVRDALVLAPATRVRVDSMTPVDGGSERFVAMVDSGVVRVVTRAPDGRTCFALRTGDQLAHLENVHASMSVAVESGNTGIAVYDGAVVMPLGERRIRVTKGKLRTIIDGQFSGARAVRDRERSMAIGLTTMPGLELKPAKARAEADADADTDADADGDAAAAPTRMAIQIPTAPALESDLLPPGPDAIYVRMDTNKGTIIIELDAERAPISVQNFVDYVNAGFYNGLIFHRVVDRGIGVVQGGGFDASRVRRETRAPISNEWENGLKNVRGSLSMARRGRQPDSATSQFFINTRDNVVLDQANDGAAYAVFGRVVRGMEVVDAIAAIPTKRIDNLFRELPTETVEMVRVQVTEREAATDG